MPSPCGDRTCLRPPASAATAAEVKHSECQAIEPSTGIANFIHRVGPG